MQGCCTGRGVTKAEPGVEWITHSMGSSMAGNGDAEGRERAPDVVWAYAVQVVVV